MYDTEHYTALMTRLSHEKQHLENAKMNIQEYSLSLSLRSVWIKQIEKEIECEVEFLKSKGIEVYHSTDDTETLSDDELLKQLEG